MQTFEQIRNKWDLWRHKTAFKYYRKLGMEIKDCLQIIDEGIFQGLQLADKKNLTGYHKENFSLKAAFWYLLSKARPYIRHKKHTINADFNFNHNSNSKRYEDQYIFWFTVEYIKTQLNKRCKDLLDLLIRGYNGRAIAKKIGVSPQYIYWLMKKYIRPAFRKEGLTL